MSAVNRATDTFERALPLIVVVAILLVGYFLFAQPRIADYLRSRTEAVSLEARVRDLQDQINRGRGVTPADTAATMKLFEERLSAEDKVSDVAELMARAALDAGPTGTVRGLQIQTGESVQWQPGQGSGRPGSAEGGPDPRFGLFPVSYTYTPVTVSFESSYEAIGRFIARLRDTPTVIEIRTLDLTRGLPYMRVELGVFVYQRGAAQGLPAPVQAPPGGPVPGPAAPRVALLTAGGGI